MNIALENDNGDDLVHVTMSRRQRRRLNEFCAERGRRGPDGRQASHSLLDGDVDWSIGLVLEFAARASAKDCTEDFIRRVNRLRETNPGLGLRVTSGRNLKIKLGPFCLIPNNQGVLRVTPSAKKPDSIPPVSDGAPVL